MIIYPCNRAIKIRIQIIEICYKEESLLYTQRTRVPSVCWHGTAPGGSQCVLERGSLGNTSAVGETGSFLVICPGEEVGQKRLWPWLQTEGEGSASPDGSRGGTLGRGCPVFLPGG